MAYSSALAVNSDGMAIATTRLTGAFPCPGSVWDTMSKVGLAAQTVSQGAETTHGLVKARKMSRAQVVLED